MNSMANQKRSLVVPGVEEPDDAGVVELAEDVDLALEALLEADLDGQFGGQHLDGGAVGAGRRVCGAAGAVDGAHAAAADLFLDDPRAESNADHDEVPVQKTRRAAISISRRTTIVEQGALPAAFGVRRFIAALFSLFLFLTRSSPHFLSLFIRIPRRSPQEKTGTPDEFDQSPSWGE